MKLVYFTDPHGKRTDFWNALSIAIENGIKIIACGGDLYPKETSSWNNLYQIQKRFVLKFLPEFLKECNKNNIHFVTILGNDDLVSLDPLFNKICGRFDTCHDISREKAILEEWEFIGFDLVNDLPFLLKDRVRRDREVDTFPKTIYGVFSSDSGKFKKIPWQQEYFKLPPKQVHLSEAYKAHSKQVSSS